MSHIIDVKNISKEFKNLKREPSLKGYFKTLLSRNYEIKKALSNVNL